MAMIRHSQGRGEEAYQLERRSLKTIKATAGERSLWTAQVQYHLARTLFTRGETQEARCVLRNQH
jgi:hypothetical protein